MTTVAIVILNYNGQHFLEMFLPSVVSYSSPHTIYVADSASTDSSVEWLKANYPSIRLVELPSNYGFAGGYNRSLAHIEADYFVLLNSDVEVTPNWIPPLLDLLESNQNIAACQPKLLSYHQQNEFEYAGAAGGYLDWLGYSFCRGRMFYVCEKDEGQYNSVQKIFWATGACLMIRAKLFQEMGGFDEDFFAHMEEIDLCWRLQLHGHQIYYVPNSTVFHVGGGTLPASNPFKTYLNYRNSLAMMYKNLPEERKWRTLFLRLILDGISAVRYLPKFEWQNILAILKGHFAFYSMVSILAQKRQKIWSDKNITKTRASLPVYGKSIVWEYFARNKKYFKDLNGFYGEVANKGSLGQ